MKTKRAVYLIIALTILLVSIKGNEAHEYILSVGSSGIINANQHEEVLSYGYSAILRLDALE